jgi:hypothetical protein
MGFAKFHPHPHAIVADGLFRPNGTFYRQPKTKPKELEQILRQFGVGKFSKIHCNWWTGLDLLVAHRGVSSI